MPAIVDVEQREKRRTRGANAGIAGHGNPGIVLRNHACTERSRDGCRVVRRTVIDNDDFVYAARLRGDAAQTVA
jgi:hypothetical protein